MATLQKIRRKAGAILQIIRAIDVRTQCNYTAAGGFEAVIKVNTRGAARPPKARPSSGAAYGSSSNDLDYIDPSFWTID